MATSKGLFCIGTGLILLGLVTLNSTACELCGVPPETLSEQIGNADVAIVVQRVSASPPSDALATGSLTVKVLHLLKDGRQKKVDDLSTDGEITLDQYREGAPRELYFLVGGVDPESGSMIWGSPQDLTASAVGYLKQLPAKEAPSVERFRFFLKYLEHEDTAVSNDAWGEVAGSKYEDMKACREFLPVSRMRAWLASPDTLPTRTGLYALLLGISGHQEDVPLLEAAVFGQGAEESTGLMAKMGGYLLLTRGRGLDRMHREIILNPDATESELFAALSVYRFLWSYEPETIPRDKLRLSMHQLLSNPQLGGLVIVDLARWKDWEVLDRVVEMFSHPDFSDRSSRHTIVRYLLAATKDVPETESAGTPLPSHAAKAHEHLTRLRSEFPGLVESAQRLNFD